MTTKQTFGSRPWLDHVFTAEPARKVKGRTRWTHRHATWVGALRRLAYVESRTELIGLLALEYLHRIGQVRRFKEQPFTTTKDEFGCEYTPDFCAEHANGSVYVIEVKAARFITRQVEDELEQRQAQFADQGLQYLLWTDMSPLNTALRHNLLRLRRASTEDIRSSDLDSLVDTLQHSAALPVSTLYQRNFDLDLIACAAWQGRVFYPMHEALDARTRVTVCPSPALAETLFAASPDTESWWNSLEDAA